MILVGLTGGLGSGKSVVAKLLRILGISVYDSDSEAKRLMESSAQIREKLIALFGEKAYVDQSLNRSYIAERVFCNSDLLLKLNAIVHPVVRQDFVNWSATQPGKIAVVESAILFDSGLSEILDKIICVAAPVELRVKRAINRGGATSDQVYQRINAQMSESERLERSDFVVVNDDETPLIPQVLGLLSELYSV